MILSPRRNLSAAFIAGALLPLAYAPFNQFWIAPLSFAALMLLWRASNPRAAFLSGLFFGFGSFLGGIHWVYVSIHDFGQAHPLFAALVTLALVAGMSLYVALTGWLAARFFVTDGPRAWLGVFPALWVLTEWWRGWFVSGFGWLAAGYSQTESWLMGYAAIGGVHLISWTVLLTAGAIVTLYAGSMRARAAAVILVLTVWVGAFTAGRVSWTEPRDASLSVALVQGAVRQDQKWLPSQFLPTLDLYRDLTLQSQGSDLIVWPEAAIPALYGQVADYLAETRDLVRRQGSDLMLGILSSDSDRGAIQNTVVALDDPHKVYVKRHLVPYGEYFPVPDFVRNWLRLANLPYSDAVPGAPGQPPLNFAGEAIAVTICYEDVFGAEQLHNLPDATLLVNVSNDAWFGESIAPHQHLQIARVRAAEAGRYLLRATNTGISAIITPRGTVAASSPSFEPHVLRGVVHGFTGSTPYSRWGNYAVVVSMLLLLLSQSLTTKFTIRPGT
jgi:apolipoprotein N-acyltransferase